MVIKATYNYAHAMTVLQEWLKDDAQGKDNHIYVLGDKRYIVGLSGIVYLSKGHNIINFFIKNEDVKITEEAVFVLVNKDLENEIEIAFNVETFQQLGHVNYILNLLSTNIMNMSDAW